MKSKKLLSAIAAGTGVIFGIVPACDGAICKGRVTLQAEIPVIRKAAERNGIKYGSDDWFILLAIRKAENGGNGRQFGIMNPKAYNLNTQAGWCAATITKNRVRWSDAGKQSDFINFLADRYCPRKCDPVGNFNWKKNVKFWFRKFKFAK